MIAARICNFAVQTIPGAYDEVIREAEDNIARETDPAERAKMRARMNEFFESVSPVQA